MVNFADLGQTITIVNKSGKVVGTSKHLVNVFKEAKAAYRERKVELSTKRRADFESREASSRLEQLRLDDADNLSRSSSKVHRKPVGSATTKPHRRHSRTGSVHSGHSGHSSHSHRRYSRPHVERGVTDSFYINDSGSPKSPRRSKTTPLDFNLTEEDVTNKELTRRHSANSILAAPLRQSRSFSTGHVYDDDIDMDLAYGDIPPPLPSSKLKEEAQLRAEMTKLQKILEEANCLQYSVTAMIENLQQNPDALAAVALTLAEMSNLAAKMAPGVLAAMKTSFPAALALLASPQFMIAAGVGVGVTIVMLGGYKIIKKIKEKKDIEAEEATGTIDETELREIDRIELWRRGIEEAERESLGTSVDGEFVTPMARERLVEEGTLMPGDVKESDKERKRREKKEGKEREKKAEKVRRTKSKSSKTKEGSEKGKEKKKEPSGLKMLFKSHAEVQA
ncbi:hypothetical protein K402DRAFT_467436 [Aulographum hederae CBS 113979]|uniref:Uncharacterized protein n=1 Tax=Aulographum hederae CBS 113979 TaxID=1176131 RepID=A0A6G1GKQ6_9PEZI|nr:hypothetical protein K402DRAFT_467436 [Aulographum hederae CBS 113979]